MNQLNSKSKLISAVKQSVDLINYVNEIDTELYSPTGQHILVGWRPTVFRS